MANLLTLVLGMSSVKVMLSSSFLLSLVIYAIISSQSRSIIHDSYPWDWDHESSSYENYSDQLLEYLRTNVQLDVWDSTVKNKDNSYKYKSTMLLKNSEQKVFQIQFNNNDNDGTKDSKTSSSSSIGNTDTKKILDPVTGVALSKYDRKHIMEYIQKKMADTCVVLADGYWNYEWCSQKEFRQFHAENPVKGKGFIRDPDFSLGMNTRVAIFDAL